MILSNNNISYSLMNAVNSILKKLNHGKMGINEE
jgi:GTP-sensing pleiotropic transcriptional regulator CodY